MDQREISYSKKNTVLGTRLQTLRKEKKLTQRELASKLKIAQSTIALYEVKKREPDINTLQKLAGFFEVSLDYLTGRTDEPHPLGYDPDKVEAVFLWRKGGNNQELQELSEADQKQLDTILRKIAHMVAQKKKEENGKS